MMLGNVVVTGGGTGGHVFTGIAVLDEVRRRNPSARTTFLGSASGHEARLVPPSGHGLETLDVWPLRLNGVEGAARALTYIPGAVLAAARTLRASRPEVVLGVGGAASGPTLIAARALGIRTLLHEQNAVPGLANRLAGSFVANILVGLPQVRGRFVARPDVVWTGNPVRGDLLASLWAHVPRQAQGTAADPIVVLVLGGSDGSSFLNARMPAVIARAVLETRQRKAALGDASGCHVRVLHQAGGAQAERIEAAYARESRDAGGVQATVTSFVGDMGAAYRAAHIAIALAGAGTLAELSLTGVATIVVPLATSADDHQRENAMHFARHGAIRLLDQRALERDDSAATSELAQLFGDATMRASLGARFRALATPGAAAAIVDRLQGRTR